MRVLDSSMAFVLSILLVPMFVTLTSSANAGNFAVQKLKVKEGFQSQSPTGALANAWHSTVALEVDFYKPPQDPKQSSQPTLANGHGTGSIVFKEERTDGTYLGILTAKHVANSENMVLLTVSLDHNKNLPIEIVAHDISKTHDLSLIVVRVPSAIVQKLEPIPLAKNCDLKPNDPLAFIGFPGVSMRPKEFQRVPIPDSSQIRKRWSTGVFEGTLNSAGVGPLLGTSVDAIAGNSGGPAINVNGEQVGVVGSAFLGGILYAGDDNVFQLRAHSGIVDCNETKKFAMDSWQKFLDFVGTTL